MIKESLTYTPVFKIPGLRTEMGVVPKQTLTEQLITENDPKKIKDLLDQVNQGFYKRHSRGPDPVIISVGGLLKDSGIHYDSKEMDIYSAILAKNNIPVGKLEMENPTKIGVLRHYFIAAKQKEYAREVFSNVPELSRYRISPVKQITGPDQERLPKSTALVHKRGFENVNSLFTRLNLGFRMNRRISAEIFFEKDMCPVPIYRLQSGIFYPVDQEKTLVSYIQERLERVKNL